MAAAPAGPAAGGDAPVSLLPSTPAGLQTASLTIGAIDDMTFLFEVDSAELSSEAQSELRALAEALHGDGSDIQVLGFASGQDASEDQARKLALSRALKGSSEEHTSELQSLMRISYAVFGLTKKKNQA